ncbi:biopolymer transporter Tol [Rathayibacter sp. VKM Ac-2927]|uniref:TolB family protein n=1 Tax=Rathayibacter sp. VKM Ac-2927 TaxID=2929478 RepID=UPI001FB25097|nr:biopolymer transporter Tol [Rathayibacter sp. VKM Ac-2927]MCJ1688357.1 biopolymer transporter Tol [Rathayibacter sp. VKM Ac-2927]
MARELAAGQRSRIHIIDVTTGEDRIAHESESVLYEAPNWTLDGSALIVNGNGHLFRLALTAESTPERIDFGSLPELNNDHVLDPDGEHVFISANDWHIYRAPLLGGAPVRITNDDGRLHFLHGVSPDGATLAYIGIEQGVDGEWGAGDIWAIPATGGEDVAITRDGFPDDGSEYSSDGQWLYFNSERADTGPGHAQLYRMKPNGSGTEQLTFDERVNWFPHIAPDGSRIAFISFPSGTLGHPADLDCIIRVCGPAGEDVVDLVQVFGGQGTMNVNSWSPDSRAFAYVDYPLDDA